MFGFRDLSESKEENLPANESSYGVPGLDTAILPSVPWENHNGGYQYHNIPAL